MKADGLQLSNWMKNNINGANVQLDEIKPRMLDEVLCTIPPKPILEPIPLSVDWMEKFKFRLHPWGWAKDGYPLIRYMPRREKFWVELGNGYRIDLPYVHTFQNFIFLTGKPLNILP